MEVFNFKQPKIYQISKLSSSESCFRDISLIGATDYIHACKKLCKQRLSLVKKQGLCISPLLWCAVFHTLFPNLLCHFFPHKVLNDMLNFVTPPLCLELQFHQQMDAPILLFGMCSGIAPCTVYLLVCKLISTDYHLPVTDDNIPYGICHLRRHIPGNANRC